MPTNGTTAKEVCNGTAPGLSETPFRYNNDVGLVACFAAAAAGSSALIDSAIAIARSDDYAPVKPRAAFSPRIGISFPLTERAAMFLNFGRYARSPAYHDMYRYSGAGTRAGMSLDDDRMCDVIRARPETSECTPSFLMPDTFPEFIGNPGLPYQHATQWEAGFRSQIGRWHSIDFSFFSNDQDHLPTVFSQGQVPDVGLTYGAIGDRSVRTVLSIGWLSSNGVSITIRRRLHNAFAYSVNYTYERSSESGARPDLVAEAVATRELFANLAEHPTARNRPHLLSAEGSVQWTDNVPRQLGRVGRAMLANSRAVASLSAASGSRSKLDGGGCVPAMLCAVLARRVSGTSNLVNLMYSKSITTGAPHWSLVVRVQNLFDSDDGSGSLMSVPFLNGGAGGTITTGRGGVAFRRILSGVVVTF